MRTSVFAFSLSLRGSRAVKNIGPQVCQQLQAEKAQQDNPSSRSATSGPISYAQIARIEIAQPAAFADAICVVMRCSE